MKGGGDLGERVEKPDGTVREKERGIAHIIKERKGT